MPEPLSSSGDPPMVPPSPPTPPGLRYIPTTPGRENGLVLGNAKGIPVPSTPDRGKPVPTLTELLASSRKSKPRIRPKKKKPNLFANEDIAESPTKGKAYERRTTPIMEISPAKSLLSSPASGDESCSDVQGSPPPISIQMASIPDPFLDHQEMFAPEIHSTQHNHPHHDHLFDPPSGSVVPGLQYVGIGTLGRGGSGVWGGGGYNSQFDVEGQVDRVSDLLEKDVDFDGWLKEMPPDPEEEEV
jgi:neural Wiskott-Aldrich syndrome protein